MVSDRFQQHVLLYERESVKEGKKDDQDSVNFTFTFTFTGAVSACCHSSLTMAIIQSALFNFQSLLLVFLLIICTSAYAHSMMPGIMDRNQHGYGQSPS